MAKLRVNLQAREFEVEGSEAFVESYGARIEQLLHRLVEGARTAPEEATAADEPTAVAPAPAAATTDDGGFGAFLHALPRNATDVDRILLAGWFVQAHNAERTFTTADANRHLVDQGIKVGNASQSVKQNLLAKRAFQVQRGRYRVAQPGLQHLTQLTGGKVPAPG
ncbi:MAG: hypothetical protein EA356_00290 [Geminicoccaceae bacterium]|nr:MAG: hypothetical protein EA356_00290 [Geminicoccaceae bacterium]